MAPENEVFENIREMRGNIEKARQTQSGKVIAFYNLGLSSDEIARKTGMAVGDVQQILLTHKKNNS